MPRHVAPDYFEWLDVQVALETSAVQSTDVPASVAALAGLALASPVQAVAKTIPEPVPVEQTVAAASVGVVSSPSVSVGSAAVESGTDSQPAKKRKRTSGRGYYCAVPLCSNRSLDMSLAIHRFPSDAERCKLWQFEIRRDVGSNFKITSNTRVCSSHFKQDDYVGKLLSGEEPERKWLNPTAVPTQFQWTATPKPARRVLKRKRQESEEPQDIDDSGVVSVVSVRLLTQHRPLVM